MNIPFSKKIQLWVVFRVIGFQNAILTFFNKLLFKKLKEQPKSIVIFKVGNIGDVICAIPSFIAIRKAFTGAKITLLTSSGKKGTLGARELLDGVWYLDELKVYYAEDIADIEYRKNLLKELKEKKVDLFIQIPDDWANFKILFRNLFFAKLIGAKSAFGFKVRTILNLFKKTQIDYLFEKTEVEFLLDLLRTNGIHSDKAEFIFNVTSEAEQNVKNLFKEKFGDANDNLIIGICPGGKGREKRWMPERFGAVAQYFEKNAKNDLSFLATKNKFSSHQAKFVIFGAGDYDASASEIIKKYISDNNVLNAVNKLSLIESLTMLKKCSFLLTNDTGTMHLAVAVGKPVVALFSVRNILGKWFPYGKQHKVLFHRFLDCDYKKEECAIKSLEAISVEEVINKCEELIKEIKRN